MKFISSHPIVFRVRFDTSEPRADNRRASSDLPCRAGTPGVRHVDHTPLHARSAWLAAAATFSRQPGDSLSLLKQGRLISIEALPWKGLSTANLVYGVLYLLGFKRRREDLPGCVR